VSTPVFELKTRPDHEVAQRAGNQHVIRLCQRTDPRLWQCLPTTAFDADRVRAFEASGGLDQKPAGM
jgi:hypothetical protein